MPAQSHGKADTAAVPKTAEPAFHGAGSTSKTVPQQVIARLDPGNIERSAGQKLTLQLEPEHLGRVEVQVSLRSDRLEVILQAESQAARQALRESVHELVRALGGKAEVRWAQVDVRILEAPPGEQEKDEQEREQGTRERDDQNPDGSGERRHGTGRR